MNKRGTRTKIRLFSKSAEQDSLSAAVQQLRLSAAVVSHRTQALESNFGVRPLNRTIRRVQPTEEGLAIYDACQDVISVLEYAECIVADVGGTLQGTLRVTAPFGLGRRFFGPLVLACNQTHPQINIQLRLSDHLIDHLTEDAAIRMAMMPKWALMGRGIAMKQLWKIADHLREGRLQPMLLDYAPEPATLCASYPLRRLLPVKVKAFADFAVRRIAAELRAMPNGLDLAALR